MPRMILTGCLNLSSAPTSLAVSPDNKKLYVASADGKVTVFDTTTRAVLATRTVSGVPAGVSVSNDGSTLFVTDTVSIDLSPVFQIDFLKTKSDDDEESDGDPDTYRQQTFGILVGLSAWPGL